MGYGSVETANQKKRKENKITMSKNWKNECIGIMAVISDLSCSTQKRLTALV